MARINVIAAMAKNRVIGINNTLPWHLPEDLRHFKALTMGHHIIMGRKTYESIGRPLPGRTTVIVTRDPDYRVAGCLTAHSLDAAIAACGSDAEVFFVGGADLYRQILPRADRLYLTEIQAEYEGDAHFPAFDLAAWQETARERHVSAAGLAYHFVTYDRA
ncbi:dihydrofolate reductase [Sulfuritortus calidifontis]|uniref:Dihydrofolate reductase n=1 Tax=Sulfuritortus calidifontis TaxID=1914471 RepID=A0A4R3JYK1_9PROT|nr:dihydrofolate reductase [Sulfuritortus calidifontis]TCS73893.1 dihydrofolate reductase [Sulfuritortus calidifontis]